MRTHPPRPALALAVGIIGHRPNRLPSEPAKLAKIADEIAAVLAAIGRETVAAHNKYADYFSGQQPVVAVVSGLAEGADRLGAHAAIALKQAANDAGAAFELDVPVPFPVEVYKEDFKTEQSKSEFDTLLGHARYALILPGERDRSGDSGRRVVLRENRSYEDAGLTLLNQSDVILAVWDGKPGAGRGGLRDLLDTAARAGTPIIHIDANCDVATRIFWNGFDRFPTTPNAVDDLPAQGVGPELPGVVDRLLRPPEAERDLERLRLKRYYEKRLPPRNFGLAFPMLMALLEVRERRYSDWLPPRPEELAAELVKFDGSEPPNAKLQQTSVLATAFGWADAKGLRASQVFRSALIMNFLLGALASVAATVSLPGSDFDSPGRTEAIETREVAERLRVAFPQWMLGLRPTTFPAEEPAWTGWYARAIVREQGMRPAILDAAGLQQSRATLRGVLSDQYLYLRITARRMSSMVKRLKFIEGLLFTSTMLGLIVFFYAWLEGVTLTPGWTVFLGALPALATATFGIRVIGDFDGIARGSKRIYQVLEVIIDAIDTEDPPSLAALRARARAASDLMFGDVSSWRLVAESRTLAIPG
jgi:hypothetical protein